MLDPQGDLKLRLGHLTYDGSDGGEGFFFDPLGIAVSSDGRYLFVCDFRFISAYNIP